MAAWRWDQASFPTYGASIGGNGSVVLASAVVPSKATLSHIRPYYDQVRVDIATLGPVRQRRSYFFHPS